MFLKQSLRHNQLGPLVLFADLAVIIKINIIYIKEGSDANNMGGGRGGGGWG